ncbi:MAG: carboxypeptidase M32 [Alphaproteobacteria bacterium]|nr:carboxypeptidase M32 [Alphaproteobacteria bacterium]
MSWQKLDELCVKLEGLGHAEAILDADEAIFMPVGGGDKRAEAMAVLAGIHHETATAPEVADWIAAAEREIDSEAQRLALAEFGRVYRNMTCLPTAFVRRQTETRTKSMQVWREARPRGDWTFFRPVLEEVVRLTREEAAMRAEILGLAPYDALMEQYDPGNRVADIDPVFERLRAFLTDFLPEALEAQKRRLASRALRPLKGTFPVENQTALGVEMARALGFDFDHGRLDVSHHPFTGGVPTDIRMTTRYRTDAFLPSLMAVLHETGHAQYEQGLPKTGAHWPNARARGMAMHESQSLFNEMQIARSPEFWAWGLAILRKHMGIELADWTVDDVIAHVNLVEKGLIRVDADEVTYPLHVILRYEIEKALLAGEIEVRDIPEIWDDKMTASLGLSTIDDAVNGPMQDVHWSGGSFGYFPSYTLGAMMAAQQRAALQRDLPDIGEDMKKGDFSRINAWRAEKIWSQGSNRSTPELMVFATGEPLRAEYFESHLKARYGG